MASFLLANPAASVLFKVLKFLPHNPQTCKYLIFPARSNKNGIGTKDKKRGTYVLYEVIPHRLIGVCTT